MRAGSGSTEQVVNPNCRLKYGTTNLSSELGCSKRLKPNRTVNGHAGYVGYSRQHVTSL
jgi:hypothetical protein